MNRPTIYLLGATGVAGAFALFAFRFIPATWLAGVDSPTPKFLACILIFLSTLNLAIALYAHFVLPSAKRLIVRGLGALFAIGTPLCFVPTAIATFQSAEILSRFQSNRVRDGVSSEVTMEFAARIRSVDSDSFQATTLAFCTLVVAVVLMTKMYVALELQAKDQAA